jgi:hypothetical protein
MLAKEIVLDDLGRSSWSEVADLCKRLLTPEMLRKEFDEGAIRRKDFCEFLGIADSTLTGWFQAGEIPRMAALSYVLFVASRRLARKFAHAEADARRPRVIRLADTRLADRFAVAQFARGEHEEAGEILSCQQYEVARAIADIPGKLEPIAMYLNEISEDFEAAGEWSRDIDEIQTLLTDSRAWREKYGPMKV